MEREQFPSHPEHEPMSKNEEEADMLLEKADQEIGEPMKSELEATEEERKEIRAKRKAEKEAVTDKVFEEGVMSDEEFKQKTRKLPDVNILNLDSPDEIPENEDSDKRPKLRKKDRF